MAVSSKSDTPPETGDPERTLRDQLRSFLSSNQAPSLVLNTACQLCGWCLAPSMLTRVFTSAEPILETFMSDLYLILRGLFDSKGVQAPWPLSYSVLHVSSMILYGSRLGSLRPEADMRSSETYLIAIRSVMPRLGSIVQNFRGLGGLYRILESLLEGHYLEETVCDSHLSRGSKLT